MAYKKTGDGGNGGGSAPTDTDDFIFSKLIPFAGDQGFVANRAPSPGTAPNRECWIHQGSVGVPESPYIYIRTRDNCAYCFTGLDINLGEDIYDQPDNPCNSPDSASYLDPGTTSAQDTPVMRGSASAWSGHHLFSNATGDYIHGVAQLGAREFSHIMYGKMPDANKYGLWTGGEYCFAQYWSHDAAQATNPGGNHYGGIGTIGAGNAASRPQKNGVIHVEGLTSGVKWYIPTFKHANGASYTTAKAVGNVNNTAYSVGECQLLGLHNSFGGSMSNRWKASLIARTTPLVPVTIACKFDYAGNVGYGIVGTLPDVYYVNMADFSPGETITIGSDSYVVFPVCNSDIVNTVDTDPYSGYFGIAYKVIP
jgi:hypothetical protein